MDGVLAIIIGILTTALVAVGVHLGAFRHSPRASASIAVGRVDQWRDFDMIRRDERHAELERHYGLLGPYPEQQDD